MKIYFQLFYFLTAEVTSEPPLSQELIKQCTQDLKHHFMTYLCKVRADPLNPDSVISLEDIFTPLTLQKLGIGITEPFEDDELLDEMINDKQRGSKRLMVQGEAGSGKTTLCAKIVLDWIKEHRFEEFTMVLVVPLRESDNCTIGEIAKGYLRKNNPATVSQLNRYILGSQENVFILFDGLDEFKYEVSRPSDTKQEADTDTQYENMRPGDIIKSEQLETCPVLVTTRPWKAATIRWEEKVRKAYTFVRLDGFSQSNLSNYVLKYFQDDEERGNELIQFMEENDVIKENMAPYPIYAAMLCLMWREGDSKKCKNMQRLQTFSQVFKEMVFFLCEHYALKKCKDLSGSSLNELLKEVEEHLI